MNDLQKNLENMAVIFISPDTVVDESVIDDKIAELSGLPTFASLTKEDIEEVLNNSFDTENMCLSVIK